jgi:serine/threonine protein kinase
MEALELSLTIYLYSPQMTPITLQSHSPYYGNNQNEDKSATLWDIMSQITPGLTFIHQNEIIHGNLKSSNGNSTTGLMN